MIFFRRDFNYESTQKMWCFGLVFEIFPLKKCEEAEFNHGNSKDEREQLLKIPVESRQLHCRAASLRVAMQDI